MRAIFVCYAYNIATDRVSGTFHPEAVRHPVNFMNHSCDPNVGYRGVNSLVALSDIRPGQELRMDYGTYSFSFDHEFTCYVQRAVVPRQGHAQRLAGPGARRPAPAELHARENRASLVGLRRLSPRRRACHHRPAEACDAA